MFSKKNSRAGNAFSKKRLSTRKAFSKNVFSKKKHTSKINQHKRVLKRLLPADPVHRFRPQARQNEVLRLLQHNVQWRWGVTLTFLRVSIFFPEMAVCCEGGAILGLCAIGATPNLVPQAKSTNVDA
jgi:hypothetical protein